MMPMSDDELKQRWQEIDTDKKDYRRAFLIREARDRGRTQEEIAAVVGLKRPYVSKLIMFADFLEWYKNVPTGTKIPNLTRMR